MSGSAPEFSLLVLTTRRKVNHRLVEELTSELELGSAARVELVTVYPPRRTLAVHRVDTVDPSRVPYRPVIPVSGDALASWGGGRKLVARALRVSRRAGRKVRRAFGRAPGKVDPARALEVACATSPELARRAAAVDVVVAADPGALRGAARLGRRTDKPAIVNGAANVRKALELSGHDLPAVVGDRQAVGGADAGQGAVALPEPIERAAHRVLIAPVNFAGQAAAWAGAARRHLPDTTAMNAQIGVHPRFPFPTDYTVSRGAFAGDLGWRLGWREFVLENFTHVVAEVNRAFLGSSPGDGMVDVVDMRRAGKTVALLSHGSDARIPSVHAAREPWHAYDALSARQVNAIERAARHNTEIYNAYDGTVFVSTPGLLAFIPRATWLPLVVDFDRWHGDEPPLQRERPRVAHIPSSRQKGSHMIDPVLQSLHERGLVEYVRVQGVPHENMPELYGSADIVVEQFGIADYSTAACEAMAAGRVVVSRVADEVRERVLAATGRELPIVEANPTTLEQVILDLAHNADRARTVAVAGQAFCREVHDGRRSAEVLGAWLRGTTGTAAQDPPVM